MFIHDCLQKITIKNPYKFYKMYDFNSMELRNLQAEYFEVENSDKRIVEKILKSLNKNQLSQLNLDETFEIDYEEKLYYPILNMEDGNYIAVDKKGNVYRLNHDHSNQIKKIAANPIDFFKVYKGSKSNLENIMYE